MALKKKELSLQEIAQALNLPLTAKNKDMKVNNVSFPFGVKEGSITFYFQALKMELITETIDLEKIPLISTVHIPNANYLLCSEKEFKDKVYELRTLLSRPEKFSDDCDNPRQIDKSTFIGPNCSIADNVEIGKNCVINPNVAIYPEVKIGDNCLIHGGAVIRSRVNIGNNVIIGSNSTIGGAGFLYDSLSKTNRVISYAGTVEIGDNSIVGDNCTIEANLDGVTRIGENFRCGPHVIVAHGTRIGKRCIISGGAGVAGDVVIGDNVVIGGLSGIADGLTIGDNAVIIAKTTVFSNVKANTTVGSAIPALEKKRYFKTQYLIKNLEKYINRFKKNNKDDE